MKQILKTRIRKSGGSLIMSIPKAAQDALDLAVDQVVGISVTKSQLIVEPVQEETLQSLLEGLSAKDFALTEDDRLWLDGTVGQENFD